MEGGLNSYCDFCKMSKNGVAGETVSRIWKDGFSVMDAVPESNEIKVSIIVTVHNVADWLRPCLDSIRRQTLQDVEIICIEDGSRDNSYDILQEYEKIDNRFIVVRNPRNLGAAATRNIGVQIAKGEYVSILDGDDFFDENMLKEMYEACKKQDADVGVCNVYWRDETNKKEKKYRELSPQMLKTLNPSFSIWKVPDHIFTLFLEVPFNKIYRRDFLLRENLSFQNLPNSNDVYFAQMVMALANNIVHINKYFVHYRYNRPNQTSSNREEYPYCGYMAYLKIRKQLEKIGLLELCRRSFCDCVAGCASKSIECVSSDRKKEVTNFWKNEGFDNLGMDFCTVDNFSQKRLYEIYNNLHPVSSKKECSFISDISLADRYCFPAHMFREGEKIVLVGMEDINNAFLHQIRNTGFVKIVFIVNVNGNESLRDIELRDKEYDAILITHMDEKAAVNLKRELMDEGVSKNIIKWDNSVYRAKDLYDNAFINLLRNMEPR